MRILISRIKFFKNPFIYYLYFIFLFGLSYQSFGQTNFPPSGQIAYKHFNEDDGLPPSSVYRVVQDSKGFVWFLTDMGLYRFDGYDFKSFTVANGLISNDVFGFEEDSRGRIWISSFNSALSYYFRDSIYRIELDFEATEIFFQVEDADSNCWFLHHEGMFCLKPDGIITNYFSTDEPFNFAYNSGIYIYGSNSQSKAWFLFDEKIYEFENDSIIFFSNLPDDFPPRDINYLANINPLNFDYLVRYDYHNIYILRFNEKLETEIIPLGFSEEYLKQLSTVEFNKLIKLLIDEDWADFHRKYHDTDILKTFSQMKISHILKDKDGGYWVTLKSGVYYFYLNPSAIRNYNMAQGGKNMEILSVVVDSDNTIYMGSENGNVSSLSIDGNHKTVIVDENEPIKFIEILNDLLSIGNKIGVYIAQKNQLNESYFSKPKEFLLTSKNFDSIPLFSQENIRQKCLKIIIPIKSMSNNPETGLWVGSIGCALKIATNEQIDIDIVYRKNNRIYAILMDKQNRLWSGTSDGLYMDESESSYYLGDLHPNFSKSIKNLAADSQNLLWVGTDGFGLFTYNYDDNKSSPYLIEVLKSVNINHIFIDHNDEVWVSSNEGIKHIIIQSRKPFAYTLRSIVKEDGIISNIVNQVHVQDSFVYAATNNGLSIIDQRIKLSETIKPSIYIDRIAVNDAYYPYDTTFELNHNENEIKIDFTGLAYSRMGDITYQYKMEGVDKKWSNTRNRNITYANLLPGAYVFTVDAVLSNGEKSASPAIVKLCILPHWSDTVWFKSIVLFSLFILLYIFNHYRVKYVRNQEQKKFAVERRISGLQTQALQAQLNPHFIFNALNSIQYFVNTKDTRHANEYISKFAKLIRLNLDMAHESQVTLFEELERLSSYLVMEQLRFDNQINYNISVDKIIDQKEIKIPGMIIQPFVENSIWHGILPTDRPGKIDIIVGKIEEDIVIIIRDDGIGIEAAEKQKKPGHKSKGVSITKDRLLLLAGKSAKEDVIRVTELKDEQGRSLGTEVQITLVPGVYTVVG